MKISEKRMKTNNKIWNKAIKSLKTLTRNKIRQWKKTNIIKTQNSLLYSLKSLN